jgi:DNA modification methylase
MCGDSTCKADVERLMDGTIAVLLHADPPYGMGKEKDGVENDNLYREKLDAFQMEWWKTVRPYLEDNGSAYIWGNAEDLWRLWYCGGLKDSERLTFRNEIVWAKGDAGAGGISHQGAEGLRLFPQSTERCLFFMLGEQGFNNNADNYWDGWEPIRSYLQCERDKAGMTNKTVADLFGFHPRMADHWFSKSQWSFPLEEQYKKLQSAANGKAFKREYDELKREYDELKREYDELKREFYSTRSYFDNTHDNMTDVWNYKRVTGDDRHGHATPKPVEMIERIIKSSSPADGLVIEPFLGSGSTLIACEKTGRTCYGMELSEKYCDVILQRFQDFTGIEPQKVA